MFQDMACLLSREIYSKHHSEISESWLESSDSSEEETTRPLTSHESRMHQNNNNIKDLHWKEVRGSLDIAAPLISHETEMHTRNHNGTGGDPRMDTCPDSVASGSPVPHRCHHGGRTNHKVTGFGKFKLEVTTLLTRKMILDLATLFEYPNSLCDDLMNAKDGLASHRMVSEMEGRGQISTTDISPLIHALNSQELKGIAGKVTKAFFENLPGDEGCCHPKGPPNDEDSPNEIEERPSDSPFFSPLNPDPFAGDELMSVANNLTYQCYLEQTDDIHTAVNAPNDDDNFYQESGVETTHVSLPCGCSVVDNPTYRSKAESAASTAESNPTNVEPFYQNTAEAKESPGPTNPTVNGMRDDSERRDEIGCSYRVQTDITGPARQNTSTTATNKKKDLTLSPSNSDSLIPDNPAENSYEETTRQGKVISGSEQNDNEPFYQNTGAESDATTKLRTSRSESVGITEEGTAPLSQSIAPETAAVARGSPAWNNSSAAQDENAAEGAESKERPTTVKVAREVDQFHSYLDSLGETMLAFNDEMEKHVRSRTKEYVHRIQKEQERLMERISETARAQKGDIASKEEGLLSFLEGHTTTFREKVDRARRDLDENCVKPLVDEHGYTQLMQYQKLTQRREELQRTLAEMKDVMQSLLRAYTAPPCLSDVLDPSRKIVKVSAVAVRRLQAEKDYMVTGVVALSDDRFLITSCKLHSGKVALESVDMRGKSTFVKRFEEKSFRDPVPLYAATINEETIVAGWSDMLFTMSTSTMEPLNRIELHTIHALRGARIVCLSVDKSRGIIALGNNRNSIVHMFTASLEHVASVLPVSPIDGAIAAPVSLSRWNDHLLACDGVESAVLTYSRDDTIVARFKQPEKGLAPVALDVSGDCAYILWQNTLGQISQIQCYSLSGSGVTPVGKPEFVPDDTRFLATLPASDGCDRLVTASAGGHITVYRVLTRPQS